MAYTQLTFYLVKRGPGHTSLTQERNAGHLLRKKKMEGQQKRSGAPILFVAFTSDYKGVGKNNSGGFIYPCYRVSGLCKEEGDDKS